MFDYARKMKLAAQDSVRRLVMKIAAGLVIAVGVGFLLNALWYFLAIQLGWGPTLASLVIGLLLLGGGVAVISMASRRQHEVPSTDELKAEVEARLAYAADVAAEKAKAKAREVIDLAENSANSLVDRVSYKANRVADKAEGRAKGLAREAASAVGLDRGTLDEAGHMVERLKSGPAGTLGPLFGAFAIGVVLADRLTGRD